MREVTTVATSLSRRLVHRVLLATLVPTVTFWAALQVYEQVRIRGELDGRAADLRAAAEERTATLTRDAQASVGAAIETVESVLSESLYVGDLSLIEQVCDGLRKHSFVADVRLEDEEGEPLVPYMFALPADFDPEASQRFPLVRKGQKMGHLVLRLDLSSIPAIALASRTEAEERAQFAVQLGRTYATERFAAQLLLLLLAVTIISFAVARAVEGLISLRLAPLVDFCRRTGRGEMHVRCEVPGNDELALLGGSINAMVDELAMKRGQLEAKVRRRTAELDRANRELAGAVLEAQTASEAKSRFLAAMSHEIRTPMNGVIGMTDLLLSGELDWEHRDGLETIRASGELLMNVIDDVLDYSKIAAGKMELERAPFDLREVVEDVLDIQMERAREKDLSLTCVFAEGTPAIVVGDATRLQQVVMNLVGNAIKFTEEGEVEILVSCQERQAEAFALRFDVRDTGIGILPEHQPRLFESFTQADASTTRRFGGTGLGLAISKSLVELMGGAIGVQSEESVGSVFAFTAVFGRAEEGLVLNEAERELAGQRILIADGHADSVDAARGHLIAAGLVVVTAQTSDEAVELLREKPFEFALIGQPEGEGSGVRLAARLRDEEGGETTRLVLLGSGDLEDAEDPLREGGFEAQVRRPVRKRRLLQALLRVIGSREVDEVASALPSVADGSAGRVLIVEDNPVNRKVAVRLLGRLGYEYGLAENGEEAVAAIVAESYDVVLMDCHMPVMDGYAATSAIRDLEGPRRHVPIVALTASVLPEDRERCFEHGMSDVVVKPVRLQTLAAVLHRWVHEDTAERAAPG